MAAKQDVANEATAIAKRGLDMLRGVNGVDHHAVATLFYTPLEVERERLSSCYPICPR